MTVTVAFIKAGSPVGAPGVGVGIVRKMQEVAIDATGTFTAEEGEYIIVGNHETSMIRVAFGSAPDADTATATSASSAGYPVPAGLNSDPLIAKAGDKVNIKAAD